MNDAERFHGEGQPRVGDALEIDAELTPRVASVRRKNRLDVTGVRLIDLLDPSIAECEFSHPIHAPSHSACHANVSGGRAETVGGEVVGREILTIIIGRHVINVDLIALLANITLCSVLTQKLKLVINRVTNVQRSATSQ